VSATTSDSFGDFWFRSLTPQRTYQVDISKTGYLPTQLTVFLDKDKNVGDINLVAGGT